MRENTQMLVEDALRGDAPTILIVTNTRTATLDMEAFRGARRELVRRIRARWPRLEYAYLVEFTTGYGPRSGGRRRPHWNWLVKGVDPADVDELRELVREVWCSRVDALRELQYVETLRSAGAALKYVSDHFGKASQRPPHGFSGQRFNVSRGYFGQLTVTVARRRAREGNQLRRELWKAEQRGISDAHERELIAHQALERAAGERWVLANERGARLARDAPAAVPLVERMKRHQAGAATAAAQTPPRGASEGTATVRPRSPSESPERAAHARQSNRSGQSPAFRGPRPEP
jgi:hypothetical protein